MRTLIVFEAKEPVMCQRISTIHLHITTKCNLRCRHCSVEAARNADTSPMDRTTVTRVLKQAKDMGAENLEITGGDPLTLKPDYLESIVQDATNIGLETWVFTNAQLLGQTTAERLARAGVRRIVTSLYGRSPAVHDAFTGVSASHDRTLAGIRSAKDAGIQVIVATVVTSRTLEDVLDLPDLLERHGVDGIQFSTPVPTGRAKDMTNRDLLSEGDMDRAITEIEQAFQGLNYLFLNSLFPDPDPHLGRYCTYFVDRLAIDPLGNIVPCCLLPKELRTSLGNVHTESVQQVCSAANIADASVFHWLSKGHGAMRKALGYPEMSHNLCLLCMDMLRRLFCNAQRGEDEARPSGTRQIDRATNTRANPPDI